MQPSERQTGSCCLRGSGRKKGNAPLWGSPATNEIFKASSAKQMANNENIWKKQKGQPRYPLKTLKVAALAVGTAVQPTLICPPDTRAPQM